MPYLDGLPAAATVSVNDLIAVDQGGTANIPGTATTRKATISQFLGTSGNTYLPLIGGTLTGPLVINSTATVNGATALNGNLNVTGTSNLVGATTIRAPMVSAGLGLGGLAIDMAASYEKIGWLDISAGNGGTVTWAPGKTAVGGFIPFVAHANVGGVADAGTNPVQYSFAIASDSLDARLSSGSSFFGMNLSHNVTNGAMATHTGVLFNVNQSGTLTTNLSSQGIGVLNPWVTVAGTVTPAGGVINFNPQVILTSTAAGWGLVEAIEASVGAATGSTGMTIRGGMQMFSAGNLQGTSSDYAYGVLHSIGSPGWKVGFQIGRKQAPWGIDAAGSIMAAEPQTNGSGNGASPQKAAFGMNFATVNFSTAAWWSPGFQLQGDGTNLIGGGTIAPIATGLSIDVANYIGGSPTISNAGTAYQVNDELYDTHGGILMVDTIGGGGAITAFHYIRSPYTVAAARPATMALSGGSSANQNAVVGVTWTQQTELRLQPTAGGTVRVGSGMIAANGAVATALTNVGPTGSHTTVQEWLAITNPSGVVRWIPMF